MEEVTDHSFEGKDRSKKDYSASLAFLLPLASYLALQCERFKKNFIFFRNGILLGIFASQLYDIFTSKILLVIESTSVHIIWPCQVQNCLFANMRYCDLFGSSTNFTCVFAESKLVRW